MQLTAGVIYRYAAPDNFSRFVSLRLFLSSCLVQGAKISVLPVVVTLLEAIEPSYLKLLSHRKLLNTKVPYLASFFKSLSSVTGIKHYIL